MSKRGAGVSFIAISAILISSKYVSAAIFGSGLSNWDKNLFNSMLNYVGNTLTIFSLVTFVFGVSYIFWGEYEEQNYKNKN